MRIEREKEKVIQDRIETILPLLDERQTRQYLAAESISFGRGGKTLISRLSGVRRLSISRGEQELNDTNLTKISKGRIRQSGAGRKKELDKQPGLIDSIKEIVEPHTIGDPEKVLLWTSKSVRNIQEALELQGYKISHELVRQLLQSLGYSMQSNRKVHEGGSHPDRDTQFEYINEKSKSFISQQQPVISVDCKKKELIGNYKNNGQEWQSEKHPLEVNVYDFPDKTNGKAAPYGVYDVAHNKGWVSVGISSDTSAFAVATIRSWWENEGKTTYQNAKYLYITADGGGSNGIRNRLWKSELQQFANDSGLIIHVSHLPPGTSKWNKIEHRLFAFISKNWRGKPLESLYVIISLINGTKTKTGLTVKAVIDKNTYKTGIKIGDEELNKCNIAKNKFHGEWNYSIAPN
jgi:transposase